MIRKYSIAVFSFFIVVAVSNSGFANDAPPENLNLDPLDFYFDKKLRDPGDGHTACGHIYSSGTPRIACSFGVDQYCAIQDLEKCSMECGKMASESRKKQCNFGCYAGEKYSC